MAGTLRGKQSYFYNPSCFPNTTDIDMATVKQQAHFVFGETELRSGFVSLGDVCQDNNRANAKLKVMTFVAKALRLGINHRGLHAGSPYINDMPRVAVVLNYLTKEVWSNEQTRTVLPDDQLFLSSNITGILLSIFIFDEALSFVDILSDMLKINVSGLPKRKTREFANQPGERHMRAQENDQPIEVVGRPDVPGMHLDAPGTAYFYARTHEQKRSHEKKRQTPAQSYKGINRIYKLIALMQTALGGAYPNVKQGDSIVHLANLGLDHKYQLNNAFTFDVALAQIKLMNVDKIYTTREAWFNSLRTPGVDTFNSPYWPDGPVVRHFDGPQLQYGAGSMPTAAMLPLEVFRPTSIHKTLLPHFSSIQASIETPGALMDRDRDSGRIVNVDYVMEALGFPSAPRLMEIEAERVMNKDPFNAICDDNNVTETRLKQMLKNAREPDGAYKLLLRKFREQGHRHYTNMLGDITHPDLPDGYRHMLRWRWKNPKITPLAEHLWQAPSVGMTAYAQVKITQLLISETLVQSTDSQLFVLPVLLRASFSTYIGRYGLKIFREHIQIVCAPGTGKSDMLGKLMGLLIDGTYEVQGGASGMGLVGKHASQRLIELSHELDVAYSPTREPEGEANKIHRMLLGCLSEGVKKYKTTGETVDPVTGVKGRAPITMVSDDTNTRIGNRNHDEFHGKQCGSAYAMRDRFTTLLMTMLYSSTRPNVLGSVLNIQYNTSSEALLEVRQQYNMLQDLFARYQVGMSVGWLPKADVSLFNSLSSLMISFIAARYPNFYSAFRSVFTLCSRIITEVGMYAAWQTLFTPLNPTATVTELTAEELVWRRNEAIEAGRDPNTVQPWTLTMGEYNPDVLLPEMAKLYYCRYETLIFVMTEKLFEMTNVVSLEVTRHIAERNSKYLSYGRGPEVDPDAEQERWPVDTVNQMRSAYARPDLYPLRHFVEAYLDRDSAVFHLGIPASRSQASVRRFDNAEAGNSIAYNTFELVEEDIPAEYLKLYQTVAMPASQTNTYLKRDERPYYKLEVVGKECLKYYNPNYICVHTSILDYARSASGIFGHYKVDPDGLVQMLKGLTKEFMVTPYLPLVPCTGKDSKGHETSNCWDSKSCMAKIQTLRYMPEHFNKCPKFRVPIIIEHESKNCFYMLVSYFETDPYKISAEMINFVTYHRTPERKMILGVPSQQNHYIYEPFTLRPKHGVTLTIPGKTPVREITGVILSRYAFDSATGKSSMGTKKTLESRSFRDECMEEQFAIDYLLRNYPDEPAQELIAKYSPAGVDSRLHQWYAEHSQNLCTIPYPACIAPPVAPAPVASSKEFSTPSLRAQPEKRPATSISLLEHGRVSNVSRPKKTTTPVVPEPIRGQRISSPEAEVYASSGAYPLRTPTATTQRHRGRAAPTTDPI